MSPETISPEQPELSPEQREIAELKETVANLTKRNEELEELSLKDPLTKTFNRRGLEEITKVLISQREAVVENEKTPRPPVAVVIVDIDNFKSINDTYGHDEGDRILRETATSLQNMIRPGDVLARWGGEEFVIVCNNVDDQTIAKAFYNRENEKSQIGFSTALGEDKDRRITLSGGVTMFKPEEKTKDLDNVIARADIALYTSKHSPGKDRLTVFTDDLEKNPTA